MRKALLALCSMMFVFTFILSGVCIAETKAKGTLKAVDAAKGTVVFCPEGTKDELSMKADKEMLKGVKAGDKVNVTYDKDTISKMKKMRDVKVPVGC
ncbi:MAG TPA: hypothetical protein VJM83_00200 [Nitrospirota bacterium]|nr:hypothetical protein [Nitrospirota bacterium]